MRIIDKLVYETGFGILPKALMTNTELSIQAKAIYAYLVTYAGNGDTAFPSRSLMGYHLGVSKDTLNKYLKELREKGYIEVSKERGEHGKFGHNIYKLIPRPNSSDTVNLDSPYPKKPDTVKPDTVKPDTVNSDTKRNSNKRNSNKSNSDKRIEQAPLSSTNLKNMARIFESAFGTITQKSGEWLKDISEKIDIQLFNRGIEICKERDVVKPRYLEGIINKWLENGITTFEKLKEVEAKSKSKVSQPANKKVVQTRYHNTFEEHHKKYSPNELERRLLEMQRARREEAVNAVMGGEQ